MPSIQITEGPSNRSLSASNNQEMEFFTLALDPDDLLESGEDLEVRFEFSGDSLFDNVVQKGYIEPIWYPEFWYCGFQKVGTFKLQLFIDEVSGGQQVAESNVWTWSVSA